jgi:hypothetical protein
MKLDITGWIIAIVVAFLTLGFAALILNTVATSVSTNTTALTIVNTTAISALSQMSSLLAPLGIVVVAGIIIAVLLGSFGQGGRD